MALRRKPVFLDRIEIGRARSWDEVARLLHDLTGIWLEGAWLSQAGNEGPDGFYLERESMERH